LEALDLLKAVVSSLSYVIVTAGFFSDRKKFKCLTYCAIIFTVDIFGTFGGLEVYANYIFLSVTSLYIGKTYGYLKGFSFAVTTFAAFQWIIVFMGSIGFMLFPQESIVGAVSFVIILSAAHLATALLLRKFSHFIYRLNISNRLLFIDIGAKIFFIAFFNLFFPRYFGILGAEHYPPLALVLLTTVIIFTIYREYSVSLEKQLAISNSNLLIITQWAMKVCSKYEGLKLPGYEIENPVVQALLHELVITSERIGIAIDILINSSCKINLNDYDLYNILNDFIESALSEAKSQAEKSISIVIDSEKGSFRFLVHTHIGVSMYGEDFRIIKDNIISQIKKNRNIDISISRTDIFTQVLEVA